MIAPVLPRIFDLPSEILAEIVYGFSVEEMLKLRLTSKHWDHVVCPLLFKELWLQEPNYVMDSIPDRIASLTNNDQPSLSIGKYVRVIHLESRALSTKELYMIAEQCPNANTLEIPFKTLRNMNQRLFFSNNAKKQKKTRRTADSAEPAELEMQELFRKLFFDTAIQELRVPGTVNDDLFHSGLIYCLGGLRRLNLGTTVLPCHVPASFDLHLLDLLHSKCPLLESLTCGLSSAGRPIDIQTLRSMDPTARPVFWKSMRRLVMQFVDGTSSARRPIPYNSRAARNRALAMAPPHDPYACAESTLMLAFLALAMPNLEKLKYECNSPELDTTTTVNMTRELARLFGAPENWQDCFPRLQQVELLYLELNPHMESILYGPSIQSVTMNECCWVHNPSCAVMLKPMITMKHLTTLTLTTVHPYRSRKSIDGERAPRDKLYIDQVLDALPSLLVVLFQRGWLVCCSISPPVPVHGAEAPILAPHPLQCFRLRYVTVDDSAVFEYLSLRCPDLYMLELRNTVIRSTGAPEALRALEPPEKSSPCDLQPRLAALQPARNVIWLPFLYSSLTHTTISSLKCNNLDEGYYHYIGMVQAPSYTCDQGHQAKCVNLAQGFTYLEKRPAPLPAEEFFKTEEYPRRLVLLTRAISNDFFHSPNLQIFN